MKAPTHVYIGRMPSCGCCVALSAYNYIWREGAAEIVSDMIRSGLIVEVMPWDKYQANPPELVECPHGDIVGDGIQQGILQAET